MTVATNAVELDGSVQNGSGAGDDSGGRALVAGGSVLAIAMFIANGGNYLLNVFLGRWLTPPEFADANLMVTLMLLVTAVAVSLQLIAARFSGLHAANGEPEAATRALAQSLTRWGLGVGVVLGTILSVGALYWRDLFQSASAWPFVILGIGMPAYLVQAVGRGVLQGQMRFRPLASTFVWEMIARVALGVGLVAAGFGVSGATAALTASFVVTWFVVRRSLAWSPIGAAPASPGLSPDVVRYAAPVGVLLLGQIIVNNGDVLISKWSLDPTSAGVYAAIALAGRAVFFLSWSVATTLFPAATQCDAEGGDTDRLLHAGLAVVAVLGVCAVIGARFLGGWVLGRVFGEAYAGVSEPLAIYALATALFALANLIVSHHLALGRVREALILVGGAVLQTVLLMAASGSTDQLIRAQVIAMSVLLVAVAASHIQRVTEPSWIPNKVAA